MPQAPIYSKPLDRVLPSIRCTENMAEAVSFAAKKHDVSVSDVVRACIAYSLKLRGEGLGIATRMFRKAAKEKENAQEIKMV